MPLRALRLMMANPKLLLWAAIPFLLTSALYIAFFVTFFQWISQGLPIWMQSLGMDPTGWVIGVAQALAVLIALLSTALSFSAVASVLASPFNDFLAEAAEAYVYPPLPAAPPGSWSRTARLMAIDMAKNFAALALTAAALLLSWIPVLNIAAFALAVLLLTFQYVSYPQTRRGETLREGFRFLGRHFFCCLGFGIAHLLLFAIPIVSAIFVPVAVVGGTALFARARAENLR